MKTEDLLDAFIDSYYNTDGEYTHELFHEKLDELGLELSSSEVRELAHDIALGGVVIVHGRMNVGSTNSN